VVLGLSDARGETWTAESRGTVAHIDPKAMRLRTRDADRGRAAYFGSLPEAVARLAAGEGPLLIVEGGPDYVAAAGLGWPAVGAHGWQRLRALARDVAEVAAAQGVRPSALRVVVVPHIGDHDGVGERGAHEAVAELAGRAHVCVARVHATKGDLADLLRDHGVEGVRRVVAEAVCVSVPPVHVADAEAAALIGEALHVGLRQGRDALPVLAVPAGAGKTWAAIIAGCGRAAQGASVAIGFSTLSLGKEKHAEAHALIQEGHALPVDVRFQRGQVAECELVRDADNDDLREGIVRGVSLIGRRACLGCPRSSQNGGSCSGWQPPTVPKGCVTITTHATIAALAELPDVTIIDELPATVRQTTTTRAHLVSVSRGALAARRWRDRHPGHGELAEIIVETLNDAADGGDEVVRLDVGAVAELVRARLPEALAVAETVAGEGDDPPWPSPAGVRAGVARLWPDVGGWRVVRAVAAALRTAAVVRTDEGAKSHESRASASAGGGDVVACVGHGGWNWESREAWLLPGVGSGRGCVLGLDATAHESEDEWRAIVVSAGRELTVATVPLLGERAHGLHYRTTRLTTRRLFVRVGVRDVVAFYADAVGALRNALIRACGETPCEVGVLTHKPVADVLRWGVRLFHNPETHAPRCLLPDDHHARQIADEVARLIGLGWRFVIGHYGAHERGSNAFNTVDVVALIGSPRPDVGATAADARLLEVCADTLWRGRVRSAASQGLARGRHIRRAGVRLVYAASDDPPELPGVTWTQESATTAHAPAGPAACGVPRILEALAERWGALDVGAVAELLRRVGIGEKATDARVRVLAAALGWRRWPVKTGSAGRPRMVYAAELAHAAWSAPLVRSDLEDLPGLAAAVGVGLSVVDRDDVAAARAAAVVRTDEGAKSHESRASASRTTFTPGVERTRGAALDARDGARDGERGDARAGPRRAAGS
jgi:hypothetical protein